MGVDWVVLGVVVLFILLDTGLIIAFIKHCEESEMELLKDIYEECHPKNKKEEDIPIIDFDDDESYCLTCKHSNGGKTVLSCKYCDSSTHWKNYEPKCEDHEMKLLKDIYEECHPKTEEKKPNDDIDSVYKDEENDENELMCLSCKYGDNQTVLRCKYCDFSTNWINFEPKEED